MERALKAALQVLEKARRPDHIIPVYRVEMVLIIGADGPQSQTELSKRLGLSQAVVSRGIDFLSDIGDGRREGIGLLERVSDPDDGRLVRVRLTPAGERYCRQIAEALQLYRQ